MATASSGAPTNQVVQIEQRADQVWTKGLADHPSVFLIWKWLEAPREGEWPFVGLGSQPRRVAERGVLSHSLKKEKKLTGWGKFKQVL